MLQETRYKEKPQHAPSTQSSSIRTIRILQEQIWPDTLPDQESGTILQAFIAEPHPRGSSQLARQPAPYQLCTLHTHHPLFSLLWLVLLVRGLSLPFLLLPILLVVFDLFIGDSHRDTISLRLGFGFLVLVLVLVLGLGVGAGHGYDEFCFELIRLIPTAWGLGKGLEEGESG